mgnify:CR=1 FL=1
MKTQEINLKKDGYNFNCGSYAAGSHYKDVMGAGRLFPITKAQAKFFLKEGVILDVLNADDVEVVENILNKHGFSGRYKYTKSKTWVRLMNDLDLHRAIKKEFNL